MLFLIPVRWVGPVLSQETSQPSQTLYSMALTAGVAEMQKQWGYIDDGNRGSRVRLAPGWLALTFKLHSGVP